MLEQNLKHHLQANLATSEVGTGAYELRLTAINAIMSLCKPGHRFILAEDTQLDDCTMEVIETRLQLFVVTNMMKRLSKNEHDLNQAAEFFAAEFHSVISQVIRNRKSWRRQVERSPYLANGPRSNAIRTLSHIQRIPPISANPYINKSGAKTRQA